MTEDDELHRELLKFCLVNELDILENNIVFCHDGHIAQEQIEKNMEQQLDLEENVVPFSLLILDYNLPYMSGLEII